MTRLFLLLLFNIFSCSNTEEVTETAPPKDYSRVHNEAKAFCKAKNFNSYYYFLVDLSIHSGRNRFYVYDFKQKKIIHQNLVTHGSCDAFEENNSRYRKAKCSNRIDSHCSSSGKYKVGKRDYSSWGIKIKYWLDGLDETNSNVRDRVVVLHSWDAVADEEIYPDYSPLSWGCPAVSNNFMKLLDEKLQKTNKPVLLWIIN